MIFDSHIAGIPCQIEVTTYRPPERKIVTCTTIDPPDPGEVEYEVLDRKGYPAEWLARKMTREDEQRIEDECADRAEEEQAEAAICAAEYRAEYYR